MRWISGALLGIVVIGAIRDTVGRRVAADVVQELLDAVLARNGLVVVERQFRHALQPQARSDLAPEKRHGAIERPRALLSRRLVAERGVGEARELEIRADLDARQRDEADAG